MSNSTNTDVSSFLDTLAESFFAWFHSDILPVCTSIFDILVIIIGFTLNTLLIVTFKKRGLFAEPSSHFTLMLCVTDFISYVFLLIPNIISSITKEWILSDPVCRIHGASLFFCVFASFGFATILAIERAVKLCGNDEETYEKIFDNRKVRIILTIIVWSVATIVSHMPSTGLGNIHYDFYHQGCMLDYETDPAYLIVHFVLTIVLSLVAVITCYSMIFNTRRKAMTFNRLAGFQKANPGRKTPNSKPSLGNDPLSTISENEDEGLSGNNGTLKDIPKPVVADKPTVRPTKGRPKSSPRRQSLLFEVFSDDEENPAFHLSLTYLYLWTIIFICYLPYMIVCFYGAFNSGPLWGGFYTITILVIHASFAVKPIIYLGHNRHYQQVTKQTIPEGVRNRANSVRASFSGMAGVVEDFVFKANANKKLNTALATQKAVLIWKKKLNKRQGIFKLKNETDTKTTPVIATSINQAGGSVQNAQNADITSSETKQPVGIYQSNIGQSALNRNAITPSDVLVTSEPNSFIEKERQRLLMMATSGGDSDPKLDSQGNGSPVPGMIGENRNIDYV